MVFRMFYLMPMFLGRTYDVRHNRVGMDIFSQNDIENPKVIAETFYGASYKTVESSSDVNEVLGIRGDLSLKIKAGALDIKGLGEFMRQSANMDNSVDILIRVTFRTYSASLPSSSKPVANWQQLPADYLGTHFVQSIIYGGDLVACIRFKALKSEYLQNIKGTVKASLEAGSALEMVAKGQLEMLDEKLQGKAKLEVSYFATVPLEAVPNTIDGLKSLVSDFETHVKKVNNGWGVPVEVDLGELSMFETKMEYIKNAQLESELSFFEEGFDDLISTKARIKTWIASLPLELTKDLEHKIHDLYSRIDQTIDVYFETISNLDLSKGADQLEDANDAYRKNGKSRLTGKFKKELDKLIKKTATELEKPPERGSTTYVIYGKKECPEIEKTIKVFSGFAASTPTDAIGAGLNFICLPEQPAYGDMESEEVTNSSFIRGIKYGLLDDTPFGGYGNIVFEGVVCSACLVQDKNSIVTFYGQDNCPDDVTWVEEYSGFLMTTDLEDGGSVACVQKKPESHHDSYMEQEDPSLVMVSILDSSSENTTCPVFISCVVCSK